MTFAELSPIVLPESLGLRRASPIAAEDRSPTTTPDSTR